ncbi:MAG TPA: hypothetical protein VGO76_06415 [Luteibacter sp.]|jgi:hypothetical protein|nr:hypothetical protein [Luteibacter sp.]
MIEIWKMQSWLARHIGRMTLVNAPTATPPSCVGMSSEPQLPVCETGFLTALADVTNLFVGLFRDVPAHVPVMPPDREDLLVMRVVNVERADTPGAASSSLTVHAMRGLASWANEALVAHVLGRLMGDLPQGVVMPGGFLHALWRGDFAQGLLQAVSLLPTHVMPEQMVTEVARVVRAYVLDCLGPSGCWIVGEGGDQENDYLGSLVLVASMALAVAHHANLFGRPCVGPKRVGETIVDGAMTLTRGLLSLRGFVQAVLSRDRSIADRAIEVLRGRAVVARGAYEASGNAMSSDAEVRRALRRECLKAETRLEMAELDKSIAGTADPHRIGVLTNDRDLLAGRLRRQEPKAAEWRVEHRALRGLEPGPRLCATTSNRDAPRAVAPTRFTVPRGLTEVGEFPVEGHFTTGMGAAAARPVIPAQPSRVEVAVEPVPKVGTGYPPAVSVFLLGEGAASYGLDENTAIRCNVDVDTGDSFFIDTTIGAAMTGAVRKTMLGDGRLTDEGVFWIDYTWPSPDDRTRSRDRTYQRIKDAILRTRVIDSATGLDTGQPAFPLEVTRTPDIVAGISNPDTAPDENQMGNGQRTCINLTDSGIGLDCVSSDTDVFIAPRSKKSGAPRTGIDISRTARQAAVAAAGGAALGVDATTELVVDIEGVHSLDPWRSQRTYHANLGQVLGGNVWDTIREQMREGELSISYAIPGKDKGGAAYRSFFEAMSNATVIEPEAWQDIGRLAFPEKVLHTEGILDVVDNHAGQLPHLAFMYPFATQLSALQAEDSRLRADYAKYEVEIVRLSMGSHVDWAANELLEQNRRLHDETGVLWRAVSQRIGRLQDQAQRKVIAQYVGEGAYNMVGRFPTIDLPAGKAVRIDIDYADGSRQTRIVEIEEPFRYAPDWQAQVANATNGLGELVAGQLRPNGWVVPSFSREDPNEFRVPHGSGVIDVSVTETDSPRQLEDDWKRLSLLNLTLVYENHVATDSIRRLDMAINAHQAVLDAGNKRPVEAVARKFRDSIASLKRLRQSTASQLDALAARMTFNRAALVVLAEKMAGASIPSVRRGEGRGIRTMPGEVILGMNASIETVEKTGLGSMDAVLQTVLADVLGTAGGSTVSLDTRCRFAYMRNAPTHGNFVNPAAQTRLYSIREIMLGVVNREEDSVDITRIARDGRVVAESGHLPDAVGRFAKWCVSQQSTRNHPRSRVAAILAEKVRELGASARLKKDYADFSRQRLYGIVQRIAEAGGDAAQVAMLWLSGVVDPRLIMHFGKVVPGIVAIGSDEMSLLVSLENGRSVIFQRTMPSSDLASFVRGHLSLFDQAVMVNDGLFLPSSHMRADPPFNGMDSSTSYRTYEPNANIGFRYVPDLFDKLWEAKIGQLGKNVNSYVYTPEEEQVYLDALFWRNVVTVGMFAALPLIAIPGGAGIFIEVMLGAGFVYLGALPERLIAANADRGELFRQATADAEKGHRFLQWRGLLGAATVGRLLWRGGGFVFSRAISPAQMQAFVDANRQVTFQGGHKGHVYRGFVFRGDTRPTAAIFKDGFKLRQPTLDIRKVNGQRGGFGGGRDSLDPDGNGISTSAFYRRQSAGAYFYGGARGGYTYVVDARAEDGFHLYANDHWAKHPTDTSMQFLPWEVNYAKDIPGAFVAGAYDARDNFIPNPDYIGAFK